MIASFALAWKCSFILSFPHYSPLLSRHWMARLEIRQMFGSIYVKMDEAEKFTQNRSILFGKSEMIIHVVGQKKGVLRETFLS
ncbi:hypothetical protein [Halobacillus sp. Marseille-Q1614]|uniref:hypothetical protein n=1 Tax=Halobacillus sp. Marseille-Q1614 TaxID=2709134 RepID=UPI00156F1367|nr:hypothetical protein [Halobacillus sp. Marseille-Q1614]